MQDNKKLIINTEKDNIILKYFIDGSGSIFINYDEYQEYMENGTLFDQIICVEKRIKIYKNAFKALKKAEKQLIKEQKENSSQKFINDLIIRGEAQELDENKKLNSKATHILKKHKNGKKTVKRARFKLI